LLRFGVTGKSVVWGVTFDLAALTGVLITIAGAVLAHIEAQRYDFLVMTYRATARRLRERADCSQQLWSDFVDDCENILAARIRRGSQSGRIRGWGKCPRV
jgi:hypothetical protein